MLISIKRYYKANLNMFYNKKKLMMTIIFYLYDRFLESNQNFTTKHVKIVKIPGFSRIPGKVATLGIKTT